MTLDGQPQTCHCRHDRTMSRGNDGDFFGRNKAAGSLHARDVSSPDPDARDLTFQNNVDPACIGGPRISPPYPVMSRDPTPPLQRGTENGIAGYGTDIDNWTVRLDLYR